MEPQVTEDTRRSSLSLAADGYHGTRMWTVVASSKLAALQANGVAGIGHLYIDRDGRIPPVLCVCAKVDAKELSPARPGMAGLYEVTAEYGLPVTGQVSPKPGGGAVARWSGFTVMEKTELAWTSKDEGATRTVLMTNRKGDVLSPSPTIPSPRLRLDLEWVQPQIFDPAQYFLLMGTVNAEAFYGIPPGYGQLEAVSVVQREDGLFAPALSVVVNPLGWDFVVNDLLPGDPLQFVFILLQHRRWSVIPVPPPVFAP